MENVVGGTGIIETNILSVQYLFCLKTWVCGRCCKELFWHEDPIRHDCSSDVTTMLKRDIQNSSLAKNVYSYSSSSYCNTAFHFYLQQKFTCCLFYSAYTLIAEFTVKVFYSCWHTKIYNYKTHTSVWNLTLKEQNLNPNLHNFKHILSLELFAKHYTHCFVRH